MKKITTKSISLVLCIMMLFVMAMGTTSAASPEPRGMFPTFTSGKVYAYNSQTNSKVLVGSETWSWGATQPTVISVSYNDYVKYVNLGYDGWYFSYNVQNKDCSKMVIYGSNGDVLASKTFPYLNDSTTISWYIDGAISSEKFYVERYMEGFWYQKAQMGGFKVS